ncbi:MAG TPA: YihY/virulence factor BrkB family protein [Gemmatimonadales bacterium]|jgi:membrane protein|nr:YihY/virulence factor BrkB family protein [Gemmatimonadales bacterium]
MKLPIPRLARLFWEALRGWSKDEIPRVGASLAYYTLLSLAPILVIAIAIAGMVFGREAVQGELVGQIDALIGKDGAIAVQSMLEGAAERQAGLLAVLVGAVAFLGASLGAFLELQHALNKIFKVRLDDPRAHTKPFVVKLVENRIKSFGMILAISFLLLVSLAVSAVLAAAASWMESGSFGAPLVWQTANLVVSLGVITLLFALIYRFLPDVRLRWRDVWIGALTTALLFSVGKQLIGFYLGRSMIASSYGAAGSIVVLLLWVYYSSQIVLLGAEFTRVYVEHKGKRPRPNEFAKRDPQAHPSAPRVGAT